MTYPNASTINNVYTESNVLNSQWNANGGSFGLDPLDFVPFVNTTATPSFFGAASYNIVNDMFSAHVDIGPSGTRTSIIVKYDETNYVEMYVDYTNKLQAVSVSQDIPELADVSFPTYNSTNHAYWRISNSNRQFTFWTSPDGTTWTALTSFGYFWDASKVTIMLMAGFSDSTKNYSSNDRAVFTIINSTINAVGLSARVQNIDGVGSMPTITDPNALSAHTSGYSGNSSTFFAIGGLPEGGMTDISITNLADAAKTRYNIIQKPTTAGSGSVTWVRPYTSSTITTAYRDGSYWPHYQFAYAHTVATSPTDTNKYAFTNVQLEEVPSDFNRLDANISQYTDSCEYLPQKSFTASGNDGSISVTRSPEKPMAGNYSGKMIYGGTPVVDGGGRNVYYPFATRKALTPILFNGGTQETIIGSVSLSTTRAGTQWYAALILYDANFNLLSTTSFRSPTITPTLYTHPGSGVWQQASVTLPFTATTAVWAAVVPVVLASGPGETVYMAGHSIRGITPDISSVPTAYSNPREIQVSLKADRVNLAKNSGFTQTADGWLSFNNGATINTSASDAFGRTVSNGWGTADIGGTWTLSNGPTSDYNVGVSATGKGAHTISTLNSSRNTLLTAPTADQDIRVEITPASFAVGGPIYAGLVSRWVDASNFYYVRFEFLTSHQINLTLFKRVAGVDTTIAGPTLTSITQLIGVPVSLRFQVIGTTLKAKGWTTSTSEPVAWNITATDSTFSAAGSYGVRSSLDSSFSLGLPEPVYFDNFSVNANPISLGWDSTVGYNSFGSLKTSIIAPPPGSTGSGAFFVTGSQLINESSTQFPIITRLEIGTTYTISVYVMQGPNCPNITMKLMDANYQVLLQTDTDTTRNTEPSSISGSWIRLHGSFTIPGNGLSDYRLTFETQYADVLTNAPFDYWIDSILVEKGSLVNPYFDGSFGSADYMYEKQGGPDNRSYYYKDYSNKINRINQIIPQYTPLGRTVSLLVAQTP